MENANRNQVNSAVIKRLVEDNNYKSRKLSFGVLSSVMVSGLAVLSAWKLPALMAALDITVGGIVAIYAIYCGANIGNKFNVGKNASKYITSEMTAEESPAPVKKKILPPPESQSLGD